MRTITGSAIREIFHLLGRPGMISFAGGNPSDAALDAGTISELAGRALARHGTRLIQYGATEGFKPFLESAAEFYAAAGVVVGEGELLPTQGSQQGFDLLLTALIDPGDVVLTESPTFLGAIQAIRAHRARIVPLPMDESGPIPEAAEELIARHRPKLIYLIPNFQNPTGRTMALSRRGAMAGLASKYGVAIAEDDPYRELRYAGEPLPTIRSLDREGWVAYLGSFSKLIAPGLRTGVAIANRGWIRKMAIAKQSADVHSPTLSQAIVDGFLREGRLSAHLARIVAGYRAQLAAMLEGFAHFPEGTRHIAPEGGLFVWAELPRGIDAKAALPAAVERNVAYVPGIHFYPEGGERGSLRLNFSNSEPLRIREGMRALGEVLKECAQSEGN